MQLGKKARLALIQMLQFISSKNQFSSPLAAWAYRGSSGLELGSLGRVARRWEFLRPLSPGLLSLQSLCSSAAT